MNGNHFYFENVASGLTFKPQNSNDGAQLVQTAVNTADNTTQWSLELSNDGTTNYLVNKESGKYIRPRNSNENTIIDLRPNSWRGNFTRWSLEPTVATPNIAYSLSTTTQGNGSVHPNGGTFQAGETISLTATPSTGYEFTGWSGDATGTSNPLSLVMDNNKNITATFSLKEHTISVSTSGNGSVSPSQGTYDFGTSISISATPAVGYEFAGWSGDATGMSNPLSLTVNNNKNIVANFVLQTFQLTTSTTGNGSINPVSGTYDYGTNVTLTAIPDAGYAFDGWSGDATGSSNPTTVTMNSHKNIVASFSEIPNQQTRTIVVRAREIANQAEFDLIIGDVVVGSSGPLTSTYANYQFITAQTGNIQVYFSDNFVPNANMRVDYISIDGQVIQAESREINTSAWGTTCGNSSFTELMHCEGYIDFGYLPPVGAQVNNAPTINSIPNQTINVNAGIQTISLSGISDGDGCSQQVNLSVSSSNTNIISTTASYSSCNSTGSLTVTPQGTGTATVSITVQDNGGVLHGGTDTYQTTFTVTVLNNNPSLPTRGASVDESNIQTTIYVSPSGNNNNNGLSPTGAVRSVKKGLELSYNSLLAGNNTKLYMSNGTYNWSGAGVNWNHGSNSPAKNAVFVMEGQSKSGVVINGSQMSGEELFRIEDNKRNVVMRNFTITQAKKITFYFGKWGIVTDQSNWLLEDIDILNNATSGQNNQQFDAFILYYVKSLTVRRCRFNGNNHNGATIFCQDAIIIDSEFNDNMKTQRRSSNVGGLGFHGDNVLVKQCEFNNNGTPGGAQSWGFRSDWVHEYVDIEDCEMNGNSRAGIILEVTKGPTTLKNCSFNNNQNGLQIATTLDVTITNCEMKNNNGNAMRFTNKYRERGISDYPGAGSFQIPIGANWAAKANETVMTNNVNLTVKNCVIGSNKTSANTNILRKNTVGSDQDVNYYEQMLKNELNFDFNQYYHTNKTKPFDISFNQSTIVLGNFNQWKSITGGDVNSTFTNNDLSNVSVFTNARLLPTESTKQSKFTNQQMVLQVSPNPSNGSPILISFSHVENGAIQLLDIQGKIISQKMITSTHSIEINDDLVSGIYLVKLITSTGIRTEKLLIK